ncbi:MAG: CBS domain-containing protein [Deltaproteobacteria bacterium]|nr:CBS domain-containing protein [Deltaproteobacteria bacterium]
MEELRVKDIMVPLSEYATVSEDATLLEAVNALEKAQEEFDESRYRHRAILVMGEDDRIIGKLSQLDVLKALEPKYQQMNKPHKGMTQYGFSREFIELTFDECCLWDTPLEDICKKINQQQVKEFMYMPTKGEYVTEETSLDTAIHQLILGGHQSLLVTRGDAITGILRLTDVFVVVFQIIKECRL